MEAANDAVVVVVEGERPWRLRMMMRKWPRTNGSEGDRWRWRGRRENGVEMTQNDVIKDQFTQLNWRPLARTEILQKSRDRYEGQRKRITVMMMTETEAVPLA